MKGLIRVSSALLNALQNELTLDKEQLTSVEDVCMKYAQSQRNDECHFLGETGLKSVHKLPQFLSPLSQRPATLQIVATQSAWGKDKSWESPKPTQEIIGKSEQEGNFCCVKPVTVWGCLLL